VKNKTGELIIYLQIYWNYFQFYAKLWLSLWTYTKNEKWNNCFWRFRREFV